MTEEYLHQVQYYETDGMAIVHHSNYIRWMEEARVDWLSKAGIPYDMIEEKGILILVLTASCKYKKAVRFGDTVKIKATLPEFNGFRFKVKYVMTSPDDDSIVYAEGETTHCFMDRNLRPVRLKKQEPEIYKKFTEQLVETEETK